MDFVFFIIVFIVLAVISFVIVPRMAKDRGRDGCGWVVLSLIISPIVVIIILFALGETDESRIKRIVQEEELRESIRRGEKIKMQNLIFTDESSEVKVSPKDRVINIIVSSIVLAILIALFLHVFIN